MNKKIILVLPLMFGLFACGNKKEDKGELVTKDEFFTQLNAFESKQENVPEYFKFNKTTVHKETMGSSKYNATLKSTVTRAINGEKIVSEKNNKINKTLFGHEFVLTFNEEKNHIKRYSLQYDKKGVSDSYIHEFDVAKEEIDNKTYYTELSPDDYLSNYALKYIEMINKDEKWNGDYSKNNYYIMKKGDITNFSVEKKWEENDIYAGYLGKCAITCNIKFKTNYIVEYNRVYDNKNDKNNKMFHDEARIKCSKFDGKVSPRKNVKYETINV